MASRVRDILWTLGASALRRSALRAGVALAYHRIGATTGSRERELVAPYGTDLFEAELRLIASRFRVVPPSRLYDEARRRRRGEPFPLAISFDDDLPSHAGPASELLSRHGLPACFFVSGASLHEPREFWWEQLQRVVDGGLAGPDLVTAVLGDSGKPDPRTPLVKVLSRRIQTMTGEPRARAEDRIREAAGPPPASAGMRAADVAALAEAGFEIGFHTLRHPLLTALGDEELETALTEGRAELDELAGARITAISYPHGRADGRVAEAARRAGFVAGFTGRPESVRPAGDPLLMGRVEPSYRSVRELRAQLGRALGTAPDTEAVPRS